MKWRSDRGADFFPNYSRISLPGCAFTAMIALFRLMRPRQWLKNLMLYFPPFLGGSLLQQGVPQRGLYPFAAFCMVCSATYVFNDIVDRHRDTHHPEKRRRPLPAGHLSVSAAAWAAMALVVGGLVLSWCTQPRVFTLILLLYLLISLAYSLRLKEVVLADIFCISAGFLLRLKAGGIAFSIPLSEWLFLSVLLLSMFLSTGKRYSEKKRLGSDAVRHRRALDGYPHGFLEGVMFMTAGTVLVTYTMYVLSRHSEALLYSVPLCCFGLLRYLLRVQQGSGGDPTDSLLRDPWLFSVGGIWLLLVGWGIYGV